MFFAPFFFKFYFFVATSVLFYHSTAEACALLTFVKTFPS